MKTLRADGAQGELTLRHKTLKKERTIEDIKNSKQKDENRDANKRSSASVNEKSSFTIGGRYACISK